MDGLLGGDGGPPTVGPVPLSEALKVRAAGNAWRAPLGVQYGGGMGARNIDLPCRP